jgi:DNA-binding PadR family transcriptional regulator
MTKISKCEEVLYKVLCDYSCLDAQELQAFCRRLYKEDFKTGSISGHLRKMADAGLAAYSIDEHSKKVYWLTEAGKEKARKEILV